MKVRVFLMAALLLATMVAFAFPSSFHAVAASNPTLVSATQTSTTSSVTSISVTVPSSPAPADGDMLLVVVSPGASSVTDSLSDKYSNFLDSSNVLEYWVGYISGYTSGTITVTATFSSATSPSVQVFDIRGLNSVTSYTYTETNAPFLNCPCSNIAMPKAISPPQYSFVIFSGDFGSCLTSSSQFTNSYCPSPLNQLTTELTSGWGVNTATWGNFSFSGTASGSSDEIGAAFLVPATYVFGNLYQESAPSSYNTNPLDFVVNSASIIPFNGTMEYTNSSPITSISVVQPSTGFSRLYQNPPFQKLTVGSATFYVFNAYYPQNLAIVNSYIATFYGYNTSAFIHVYTYSSSLLIWQSYLPSSGSIAVPLSYGTIYMVNVTFGGSTQSFTWVATSQFSVGFTEIQHPVAYQTPTFSATWNPSTGQLTLAYADPNGISGTGSYKVYNTAQSVLASGSITGPLPWTVSISGLSYTRGMYVYFTAVDPIQGTITGYQSVLNSSVVNTNVISFVGLPDIGLGSMVSPGVGLTYGNFASIAILLAVAALFSQKHQDIGAIVLAVLGGLFTFWGWYTGSPISGTVSVATTTALSATIAILLFVRKGANPYNSMEDL